MLSNIFLGFFLLSSNSEAGESDEKGTIKLGTVHLMDQKDRDVINLPKCNTDKNQMVSQVQLRIKDYPAEIDLLKVKFHNGEDQVVKVKDHFARDTSSRWIDLEGTNRCISQIVIIGDTDTKQRAPNKQASVSVWGR